jgi:two-component system cell cycle sensor histidine kinase PleC
VVDGLSHDVRTPLGVMLGFTDLLLDGAGGPLTDEQRQLLDHVCAGGDRIVAILQRYLKEAEAGPGER